tara:strand:- start:1881 stop:2741 length:861 start_codon:yes stop_codon:yes gene_type:complete
MYENLKTRNIDLTVNSNIKDKQKIRNKLQQCLKICYINNAFSTFPYLIHKLTSKRAIDKFGCGNCIGLSMSIIECMKKNWGITGFLIPATVPNMYKHPQYLDIAHVAVAVPVTENKIYIVDPAFYFNAPMLMQRNKSTNPKTKSKNIYSNTCDIVDSETYHLARDIRLNDYQFLPKNTLYNKCSYQKEPSDKWYYFMRQVINPDESIGKFYLAIKNLPFITTTKPDSVDGSPKMHIMIKQIDGSGNYDITVDNKSFFTGKLNDLTTDQIKLLKKELGHFNNGSIPL